MATPLPFLRGTFLVALLMGFASGSPLIAQNVTPLGPDNPTGPVGGSAGNGSSNYQGAQVATILDLYEGLSGKHLVCDANLASVPPISLNVSGLSKAEELKLIEAVLQLNGVSIIPIDDRSSKVIFAQTPAKNARSEGIKLYANSADLPTDDTVVSYYMPLNYLSPQETATIFLAQAPLHAYGAYVPAPTAQAIIVTENANVVRQLIALKELIDVPPAPVVSEFVQLNRADAEKVAELLTKLLDQKGAGPAPAGGPAAAGAVIVPAALGNHAPLLNERNLISGPAQIVPDTRSNRLLIITRPVNIPFLKEIITQLDQPDIFLVPQRRPLRYVLAQDILPALEAALAQGKEEEDEIKKDQSGSSSTTNNNQSQNTASSGNLSSSGQGGGLSSVTSPLQAPNRNNAPTVVTIGKTRLLADNHSNSIIVFGSPDVVSRVFDMIDQLDRKPLQVYLATVIGELTVSEGMEFGIDILQKFQRVGQGGLASGLVTPGTNKIGTTAVPEPQSLTSALGFPLPTGLTLYGAIGSTLDAYVRALASTNRFKVISRPSVYTSNNTLAVIASGSQIPVPGSTTAGFTGSSSDLTTTSSINYENVLLELQIVPLINANHEVTLKIRQTNNSQGSSQIISGNAIPTILTQEINTEVTVPDKSTIVIGGLISDNTTRTTSGVPWLSDIPIIGYLFKDTAKNKERDELIIMIQPTVIETDADQIAANEMEKQRTILGREAVSAANGTLQTITTKTTSTPATVNSPGRTTVTVKQTTTTPAGVAPPPVNAGVVPNQSTPAPDVSNGQLPNYPKPPPSPVTQ